MKLSQALVENLYSKTPRSQHFPVNIEMEEDNVQVRLEVTDLDRLGCVLSKLEIKKQEENLEDPGKADWLKSRGDQIARKITYLLEPLWIIEWDRYYRRVQIRSFPPKVEGNFVEFYELILGEEENGTLLTLLRYRKEDRKRGKEVRPIILTKEVLERLLKDLFHILNGLN